MLMQRQGWRPSDDMIKMGADLPFSVDHRRLAWLYRNIGRFRRHCARDLLYLRRALFGVGDTRAHDIQSGAL
jgi:hypothetical protein